MDAANYHPLPWHLHPTMAPYWDSMLSKTLTIHPYFITIPSIAEIN